MFLGGVNFCFAQGVEGQDKAAEMFFYRCAGCHTIGGGNLTGPDLINAAKWTEVDLHGAIKRMEKNTGALTDDEIAQMIEFLKDLSVSERISKQKQKIESSSRTNLPAPSFEEGQRLFTGEKFLVNGGVSCINCHQFAGRGGSLGPDLTGINNKFSGVVLQSGIENAGYKIMRPIYEKHKISKEESLHLAEYLSHPERIKAGFSPSVGMVINLAWMGFGVFGALLWRLNRHRKGNAKDRLFEKHTKG